jgi:hypothetical protein
MISRPFRVDYDIGRLLCVRRNSIWLLYHNWYNRATTPWLRTDQKTIIQVIFKNYPMVLKGIRKGKLLTGVGRDGL